MKNGTTKERNTWYYERTTRNENGRNQTVYTATNTCTVCGKAFHNGNVATSKYCTECGKKIKAEQNRERVKRHREKMKQKESN